MHHLGESTLEDALSLKAEIESMGQRAVLVDGDVADPATATKVSTGFGKSHRCYQYLRLTRLIYDGVRR